jgi:hypothetical protein
VLRIFSFIQPIVIVVAALGTAVPPGRLWLLRAALSVFLCGYAIRWVAIDRAWSPLRERLRVTEAAGLWLAMVLYAAAGVVATAGAILGLPRVFAAIVSVFLLAWSAFWIWALRRMSQDVVRIGQKGV